MVGEQAPYIFEVEVWGIEVEGSVVEYDVNIFLWVVDADGGMSEEGVQFRSGRAGEEADFSFGGEGDGDCFL